MNYVPWELSLAFEQSCNEARENVQRLLEKWDGPKYNDWPVRASYALPVYVETIESVMIRVLGQVAQRGIHHSVPTKDVPGWGDDGKHVDVYFSEVIRGTKTLTQGPELAAYVVADNYETVEVHRLGCAHKRTTFHPKGGQWAVMTCEDCGYRYEVDSSG
jgi:hypothetical protein